MVSTRRENAALVRRFLLDVVAGGDTEAVEGFLASDVVTTNLVFGDTHDSEMMTTLGWKVLAAADVDVTIQEVVSADDLVAVQATVTGTHRESLMDLAPTGRSFEIAYVWFCRIDDGRIVAIDSLPDALGLLQQVGALPEQPASGSLIEPTEHP